MKSKVTVNIAGSPYTLVTTEEDVSYVEQIAARVDQMMTAVIQQARVSAMDAAVLTAVNAVDAALKEQQVSDSLRAQLKDELEEKTRVKNELAEARREIRRLKKSPK